MLTDDHIDLVVSALMAWGGDFSSGRAWCAVGPDKIGSRLRAASMRHVELQGAAQKMGLSEYLSTSQPDGPYRWSQVEDLVPVEVVKACHACQSLVGQDWDLQAMLTQILAWACYRLPGYDRTPWQWHRAGLRPDHAIGLGLDWRPGMDRVEWRHPSELGDAWSTSTPIVVTAEASVLLPEWMQSRPGVFLLAHPHDEAAIVAPLVGRLGSPVLLRWPDDQQFFTELLGLDAPVS